MLWEIPAIVGGPLEGTPEIFYGMEEHGSVQFDPLGWLSATRWKGSSVRQRLAALLDRHVKASWRLIDQQIGISGGSVRSAEFVGLVTVASACIVLVGMSFVVLDPDHQRAVALAFTEIVGWFSQSLAETLIAYQGLLRNCVWSLGCTFFYFVLPSLVVRIVFRERLRDWGIHPRGFLRHLRVYFFLFLPVGLLVFLFSFSPSFQSKYPFYRYPQGISDFLVWEAFYALQFFSLEFFFRGFLLHGLKRKIGSYAIFFMVVPYCMIHFQKPLPECLGAIVAGTVLGTLSLRTGSIWGGVAIHVTVAWSMDWAALLQR